MEKLEHLEHILQYSVIVFASLALIEAVIMFATYRKTKADPKETLANFGIMIVNRLIKSTFVGGILYVVLTTFQQFALFSLPVTWVTAVLALIAADFIYYWKHRTSHEVRWLWSYHSVHHSSKEFNLSTAMRLPWLGTFTDSLFYVPAVLLGFEPLLLIVCKILVLNYQFWVHSDTVPKLGWFDAWFNSPSNHRVHHASDVKYLDKNHGGILMVWDRMFGTYKAEEEKPHYGLTKPIGTANPITINFHEPVAMIKDAAKAGNFRDAMSYLFKGPGWKPDKAA